MEFTETSDPPVEMVLSERRVVLSNGRAVTVKISRPVNAPAWTDEDETALRAILDVAAAASGPPRPRLVS